MKEALEYLNKLLKKDDTVVVCLSGGPDSMCLLALLIKLRETKKINIIAAHVNHNVRRASAKEKEFVEKYCQKNKVVFEYLKIEKYNDDNFHNEARIIRYNYFAKVVKKYQAKYLMTAHHADDLIETILMRIVRGSTLNGYAGFKKEVKRNGYTIIRPLINNTKEEILSYNKQNKISFVIDSSNKKGKYTRNRYRQKILPFLKTEDKNVHEKFLKFSNTIDKYNSYIEKEVSQKLTKIYKNNILNIIEFKKQDKLIKVKIKVYILETIYNDDLFLINDTHTNEIMDLINSKKSSLKINLPNNLLVRKSYDKIYFENLNKPTKDYQFVLKSKINLPNKKTLEIIKTSDDTTNYVTRLHSKELKLPLIVRSRRAGDKMIVKNMLNSKKLKEIFIDNKIDLEERKVWPVVTDSNNVIVWLPGIKKSQFDKSKKEKYDIIIKYD